MMFAMRLDFDVVDVFTDRPFAGNQLAVVHGAERLSTEQCLAVAREFNFSETTFPAATGATDRYATRIFTPGGEIPFAGHPTLGTAWVLRERGVLAGEQVVQECGAGDIGVRFLGGSTELVELSATPRDRVGPVPEHLVAALLEDLGLTSADVAGPVWVGGCGLSFVHLPVVAGAVARSRVPVRPLSAYDGLGAGVRDPLEGVNVVEISGSAPRLTVHARVFVPDLSVPEDPATGSAAVGLGVVLAASGMLPDGGTFEITQGLEMGRRSLLHGRVEAEAGTATDCHVAGAVQPVATGRIEVPA
jgi:trans-2,3-dihydro-3-hydroxyanthranilate isomerase